MSRTTFINRVLPWFLPIILLVLWEYFGRISDSLYLPPLSEIFVKMREDWLFDHFQSDLVPSLSRFALGYLIGAFIGIILGMALGSNQRVAQYTGPVFEFLRALPAVAVLPVAILLFGLGDGMRISIIAFGVLFPVLVNTSVGARSCRQERIDVARMYGLSRLQIMRRVIFPSPIALIMMVVSELVGGQNGIGFYLTTAQSLFNIPAMFTALFILGILGNVINAAYAFVENRRLHWASHL